MTGVPSDLGKTMTIHSCSNIDPSSTARSGGRARILLLRLLADVEGNEKHRDNNAKPVLLQERLLGRRLHFLAGLVHNNGRRERRAAVSIPSCG